MDQIINCGSCGYVGREVQKLFPEAIEYDPPKGKTPDLTGNYSVALVNVPTPMNTDGSCNTEYVEDVISKVNADLFVIRSTIPPRTTDDLELTYGKNIVFTPEYVASSSPFPAPLGNILTRPFHVIGGRPENRKKVRRLLETKYPPTTRFIEMTAVEAEICKYMENAFIATYVTFCGEFKYISDIYNADYDVVKEGFLADPRMTPWWTYWKGGWGGDCLKKDMASIINETNSPFLKAVVEANERHKNG